MAMNASKSKKLDTLMRRLYTLGAPKAGLNHDEPFCEKTYIADVDIWTTSRLIHILTMSGLQFLLYSILLLALNPDIEIFTEAGTGDKWWPHHWPGTCRPILLFWHNFQLLKSRKQNIEYQPAPQVHSDVYMWIIDGYCGNCVFLFSTRQNPHRG